jgi:hypothetical protein
VLGIVKAYTTRVGSGPFPTELERDRRALGERGHEFGTITGRKRRCGWFDAVLVRQSAPISGITGIALTKLDVLDGFEEMKICTGYMLDGKKLDYLPAPSAGSGAVEPIYEDHARLAGNHRRRAQLGRPARAGDQIYPPRRRTDRMPGGAGLHLAAAGRHDFGDGSVESGRMLTRSSRSPV